MTPEMPIATLHTDRLTLRPHILADFADYAALWATERSQHMGGPLDVDDAWSAFCNDIAQEPLGLGKAWAVVRTHDTAHVGQVVLQHPPSFPERELGCMLYATFEGKGYAREAASAARDHAFDILGWENFVSYVSPENTASIRLCRAIGGIEDESAAAPDASDIVFRYTHNGRTA